MTRRLRRIFLLSPARIGGIRGRLLVRPGASFALASELRARGLPLADIFTFASGLYFRGKITYARRFADPATDVVRVITATAGLLEPERVLTVADLRRHGEIDIDESEPRFTRPLRRDASRLAACLQPGGQAILLGSIATAKYRETLLGVFGPQLVFPQDFVGRGDMSRGGLLLRAARDGVELPYIPVAGAVVKGTRPARLEPLLPFPRTSATASTRVRKARRRDV